MLKLLIADDEKVIRDSISSIIDWRQLNIQLIGTARDGIEAYNMILDDYPELVMTDIKMPGLSGIDLIRRIKEINQDTQFIILSGFGEFEYAKAAMQYGVRHYLLKPTNEKQITEAVAEASEEYERIRKNKKASGMERSLYRAMVTNLVSRYLSADVDDISLHEHDYYREYRRSFGTTDIPYVVHIVSFENSSAHILPPDLNEFLQKNLSSASYDCFLCGEILIIVHPDISSSPQNFLCRAENAHSLSCQTEHFENMTAAFRFITVRMRKFQLVRYYDPSSMEYTIINNARYHNADVLSLAQCMLSENHEQAGTAFSDLSRIIGKSDTDTIRQIIMIVVVTASNHVSSAQMSEYLRQVNIMTQIHSPDHLRIKASELLKTLYVQNTIAHDISKNSLSEKVHSYVESHLSDSRISLKWIAENILFLNVDYLSRKFLKETNERFSAYLTRVRVGRAAELMQADPSQNLTVIAEQVGCGNNPQYFSQIFKKSMGMTPAAYARACLSGSVSAIHSEERQFKHLQ